MVNAGSAWPSQAAITATGTPWRVHERSAGVPGVVEANPVHPGSLDERVPLVRHRLRVELFAQFIDVISTRIR
jgi:hypothetical protein